MKVCNVELLRHQKPSKEQSSHAGSKPNPRPRAAHSGNPNFPTARRLLGHHATASQLRGKISTTLSCFTPKDASESSSEGPLSAEPGICGPSLPGPINSPHRDPFQTVPAAKIVHTESAVDKPRLKLHLKHHHDVSGAYQSAHRRKNTMNTLDPTRSHSNPSAGPCESCAVESFSN